jgi:uncharacterized phage infection (PIP) family protein YhgE
MKISSHKKIEKQVQAFLSSFQFPPDVQEELDRLENEYGEISDEWNELRQVFCNSSPCICNAHPRHKEFSEKLNFYNDEINKIYKLKIHAGQQKKRELTLAVYAKQRYLAQL